MDLAKEKCFFDEYIPEELERVIKQQHEAIEYQKKNGVRLGFLVRLGLSYRLL